MYQAPVKKYVSTGIGGCCLNVFKCLSMRDCWLNTFSVGELALLTSYKIFVKFSYI